MRIKDKGKPIKIFDYKILATKALKVHAVMFKHYLKATKVWYTDRIRLEIVLQSLIKIYSFSGDFSWMISSFTPNHSVMFNQQEDYFHNKL